MCESEVFNTQPSSNLIVDDSIEHRHSESEQDNLCLLHHASLAAIPLCRCGGSAAAELPTMRQRGCPLLPICLTKSDTTAFASPNSMKVWSLKYSSLSIP